MELESRNWSYSSLEPHLWNLRVGGYYQIDPHKPILQKLMHKFYMRITLILIIIYTIQQAIRVYEVRDDLDEMMDTMFLFLTHTDSIFKQIILWIRADRIEELLDTMRGPLFNQGEVEHRTYLVQTARQGKFLMRMFNIIALITCFLWVLYPLILHLQGKHVEFAIWVPFDVNVNLQFYLTLAYIWIMTSWLAMCNTTIDVMVAFLFAQCQTQLYILRDDLTKLVQRSKNESTASHIQRKSTQSQTFFENVVHRRFVTMIKHHAEILQFVKKAQDIFGIAVAYQFLASGWIICTSVYKIVQVDLLSVEFLSMVMYIFCMLMQLFLYCYYGNEVTHEGAGAKIPDIYLRTKTSAYKSSCTEKSLHKEAKFTEYVIMHTYSSTVAMRLALTSNKSKSEMLRSSAYAMDWLRTPVKHRRHLILFMERIKRPIQPLAGFIIPLSNNTFVSIVKSSYTYYTILKNTNE